MSPAVPAPPRHATRRIAHGGVSAKVDKRIADLVLAMWKAGIRTEASCQGYPGGPAEIILSGRDEQLFRKAIGPDAAELVRTEYPGSTGSAALTGRHRMRFRLTAASLAFQRDIRRGEPGQGCRWALRVNRQAAT